MYFHAEIELRLVKEFLCFIHVEVILEKYATSFCSTAAMLCAAFETEENCFDFCLHGY
jgi:hypothetical protein